MLHNSVSIYSYPAVGTFSFVSPESSAVAPVPSCGQREAALPPSFPLAPPVPPSPDVSSAPSAVHQLPARDEVWVNFL